MAQQNLDPKEKEGHVRKRRAHQKSRRGCRNCKLRKVKCDETRPKCQKCHSFGVNCNYDSKTPDLSPSYDKQVTLSTTTSSEPFSASPQIPRTLQPLLIARDDISTFELDYENLARLDRFKNRTLNTIGTTASAHMFGDVAFDLMFSHPYLMHIILVLTSRHDRHLSPVPFSPQPLSETYHLTLATSLFNAKLSSPVQTSDKDALWATAALLGLLAYTLTDASSPEKSWPLLTPTDKDKDPLEWLQIAESKSVVWDLVNPLREGSKFSNLKTHYQKSMTSFEVPGNGKEGIPEQFCRLYGIEEWSSAGSNLYFTAVHVLVSLLPIPCERESIVRFLGFMSRMEAGFKSLVRARDPRALLLVAYFYAKVWKSTWWMERRAVLECEAICLYLERNYKDDRLLQEMLMVPKRRCGLAKEVQWIGGEELFLVKTGAELDVPLPLLYISLVKPGERSDRLHWAVVPMQGL